MWDNYPGIQAELAAFEDYLKGKLANRIEFLRTATQGIVFSGGKRLRPAFTILSAMQGNYSREKVFPAAASVEILHAATLVHDDIIDNAKTRRGQLTVSEKHSVNLAVYTGDYMLAKSLSLLVETGLQPERLELVSKAITQLCEGEVEQYLGKYELTTVNHYLKRIIRKTGILFSVSCALGARAGGLNDEETRLLTRFGISFGAAFQIRDDLLDILSDEQTEGKPVFNDLKEGIATLPIIMSAQRNPEIRKNVEELFEGTGDILSILRSVTSSGGVRESEKLKQKYTDKCRSYLKKLTPSSYTGALSDIVDWL